MGYLIGWTRQTAEVLKELETTGEYRVKEEYIRKKNGDIAGYYLELYRWYTEKSRAYLPAAVEGEFPIWFSLNSDYRLQKTEGTVIIRARIPGKWRLSSTLEDGTAGETICISAKMPRTGLTLKSF